MTRGKTKEGAHPTLVGLYIYNPTDMTIHVATIHDVLQCKKYRNAVMQNMLTEELYKI